jgi:hypothetical protein
VESVHAGRNVSSLWPVAAAWYEVLGSVVGPAAGGRGGLIGRAAAGVEVAGELRLCPMRVALLLVILRTCSKRVAAGIAVAVEPRGDRSGADRNTWSRSGLGAYGRELLVGVSQNVDTMIPGSGSFSSCRAVADSRSVGKSSMSRAAAQVKAERQTSVVADDSAVSRVQVVGGGGQAMPFTTLLSKQRRPVVEEHTCAAADVHYGSCPIGGRRRGE